MRWLIVFILLIQTLVTGCGRNDSLLEQVKNSGEIRVIIRNTSTTFYEGPDESPMGFEYDLAKQFAEYLGVELKVIVPDNLPHIFDMLENGRAHFAAAGLTVTEARKERVRFSPPYQYITQQLVYNSKAPGPRPRSVNDLTNGLLEVVAGSSHTERLNELKELNANLAWTENSELESEELLTLVWDQLIDYTVSDSNELALNLRFHPELRVAFDLSEPEPLAWAFPKNTDTSLYYAATTFFNKIKDNGVLASLQERYYGHTEDYDYYGTEYFIKQINVRLPTYQDMFEKFADEHSLDWRLLAAMSYQESHWNPDAKSYTGVRGMMMLTRTTARHLGIKERTDPEESIRGGAIWIKLLHDMIDEEVQEPDRTWMAVAAYNVGLGHLEDARTITKQRGFDANKWMHVKENLPLLRQKKWYSKTKHGYARGHEPVRYVENIRSYYDILTWLSDKAKEEKKRNLDTRALDISVPAL